jgi:dephospho-CoA kinase
MTIKVGITGGIGSGKSTVCGVFKTIGIPIFEADQVAKKLMNENREIRKTLTGWFGEELYTSGVLNRKMLSGLIFNNTELLEKVNALIHPLVRETFLQWSEEQTTPYSVYEAAILFESGFYRLMDFTILVSAPEHLRIERVIERDKITAEEVVARMKNQWSDDEKRKLASTEIINDNKNLIVPLIVEIDKKLRTDGKIW